MKKMIIVCMLVLFGQSAYAGSYYNSGIRALVKHYYEEMAFGTVEFPNAHVNFLKVVPCNEVQHGKIVRVLALTTTFKNKVEDISGSAYGTHDYWVQYMTMLYKAFYHRSYDDTGLKFWVGELDNQRPLYSAVTAFLVATEATRKAKKICGNQYLMTSETL